MKVLLFLVALPYVGVLAQGIQDTLAVVGPTADTLGTLWAWGGAFATAAILSGTKKMDTTVTNSKLFRKIQPLITLAGAFAAPLVAGKLGVQIDPAAYGAAPASTVAAILTAELLGILKRSTRR